MVLSPLDEMYAVMAKLEKSLRALGKKPTPEQLEKWATTIVDGMSGPTRLYHRTDHVLELSDTLDPLGTIAAMYHDLVYYQLDGGLPPEIQILLTNYYHVVNGVLYSTQLEEDLIYDLCIQVFGFEKGKKLFPSGGQNEFLSALVALKQLEEILPLEELLAVAACIEMTIPFRAHGEGPKALFLRIESYSKKNKLSLKKKQLNEIVERSVIIGNRDVGNFADIDVSNFLDNTWKLLPESNRRLNDSEFYSLKEYRIGLQKMESFLSHLEVSDIFTSFNKTPNQKKLFSLFMQAQANLEIATQYLRIKTYGVFLVEALAFSTGGDAPLIYFMGEGISTNRNSNCVADFLPSLSREEIRGYDPKIIQLLSQAARIERKFDKRSSPVTLYIYQSLGEAFINEQFIAYIANSQLNADYRGFMDKQPATIIRHIALACAEIASTREPQLKKLADQY